MLSKSKGATGCTELSVPLPAFLLGRQYILEHSFGVLILLHCSLFSKTLFGNNREHEGRENSTFRGQNSCLALQQGMNSPQRGEWQWMSLWNKSLKCSVTSWAEPKRGLLTLEAAVLTVIINSYYFTWSIHTYQKRTRGEKVHFFL